MYLLAAFVAAPLLEPVLASLGTTVIPDLVWPSTVTSELVSQPGGLGALDGQKVSPWPNATSFDWWYFDAVSSSSNESIVITFLETGASALSPATPGGLLLSIGGTFANGTSFILGDELFIASITTSASSVSSTWIGLEITACFTGSVTGSSNPVYSVTIDALAISVNGTISLPGIAPPHYPCNPLASGVTEQVSPHLGWANAVPDAQATVDFSIEGTAISFTGPGYHDKNWSDEPFTSLIDFWYWGHARVGPYSIVWFDLVAPQNKEYQSGYVAENGQILSLGCALGSSTVRPWGTNAVYPPTPTSGTPEGLLITFDLGSQGTFVANVTTALTALNEGIYQRYVGTVTGGFEGGETYTGTTFFEIMHLADP